MKQLVEKPRVLCVDDEPNVLEGLGLHLRRRYDLVTAGSGAEGLAILRKDASIAVVLSDMRMPNMSGAEFLSATRKERPDTVRMLLTGQTDLKSAIDAINEGQIFRFLTKPCPPPTLLGTFEAAVEQHRLLSAERVLLEQTLHGSVKALVDVLSLTNPAAFGRATRVKGKVAELSRRLSLPDAWQVEMAALLSQLGTITLPPEVTEKLHAGDALTEAEAAMVERIPVVTEQLLSNIPRLEGVRAILSGAAKPAVAQDDVGATGAGNGIQRGARILRVALDFDVLEARGDGPARAVDTLRGRNGRYDGEILDALAAMVAGSARKESVRELALSALRVGMVFVNDVRLVNGALLCARGYEVTPSFLAKAKNFRPGSVREPLRVVIPDEPAAKAG